MSTLTVTTKGQAMLHNHLLRHLGVRLAEKITVGKPPDGRVEVKTAQREGRISDVFGFLKRENGAALSIEEMNRIAANAWAGNR